MVPEYRCRICISCGFESLGLGYSNVDREERSSDFVFYKGYPFHKKCFSEVNLTTNQKIAMSKKSWDTESQDISEISEIPGFMSTIVS